MANPLLTVAQIATLTGMSASANTGTVDLTALTGGANGETGADYCVTEPSSYPRTKIDGGAQLVEAPFGLNVVGGSYYWQGFRAFLTDAEAGPIVTETQSRSYNINTEFNNGVVLNNVVADQYLRTLRWYLQLEGGPYQARVTLSDGSATVAALGLPNNGQPFGIECQFRARAPDSRLVVQIYKTGAAQGYIGSMLRVLLVPTPPVNPRAHGLARR